VPLLLGWVLLLAAAVAAAAAAAATAAAVALLLVRQQAAAARLLLAALRLQVLLLAALRLQVLLLRQAAALQGLRLLLRAPLLAAVLPRTAPQHRAGRGVRPWVLGCAGRTAVAALRLRAAGRARSRARQVAGPLLLLLLPCLLPPPLRALRSDFRRAARWLLLVLRVRRRLGRRAWGAGT
jgi:hypothetical protein